MDWHARACARVSVRLCVRRGARRKCNVLSESLIRFVPRDGQSERERERERRQRVSVQTVRFPPRNSKWTAVSDVGATEVRKYFSTFVTRPVYWFRQIVRERGSEIRDAHTRSNSHVKQQHETTIYRENVREKEKVREEGWYIGVGAYRRGVFIGRLRSTR